MKVFRWVVNTGGLFLYSLTTDDEFRLAYSTEKWTSAPAKWPQALPFAFRSEGDARAWTGRPHRRDLPGQELWLCEAEGIQPAAKVHISPGSRSLREFYSGKPGTHRVPVDGTVLCQKIKLVKVL